MILLGLRAFERHITLYLQIPKHVSNTIGAGRMDKLKPRAFVSFLLLLAICISLLSIPNANSQSAAVTTTTTIEQPPSGQCAEISLAFSARAGQELAGTFSSDASISFYILSPADFDAIRNPNCSLPSSARPLYSQTNSVGHDNPYRTLVFPSNGTYYIVFVLLNSSQAELASGFATVEVSFPASTIFITTEASYTISSSSIIVRTTQSTTESATVASTGPSFGTFGLIGLVVAVGLIASVMVFMKRGKSQTGQKVVLKQETVKKEVRPESPQPKPGPAGQNISTGYPELDTMLAGGLPLGLSIVLTGPPCDEKNLILSRFLETNLISGRECIFISTSLDRVREMLSKHKNLHVILCNPQAETIAAPYPEVVKIKTVDSLIQINLEYDVAAGGLSSGKSAILCLEILDDVLLEHHAATRRWLMDILGRGKGIQMTCLATLNPAMHSTQELQAILETFDGHIDLYEAEVQGRPKLIQVKKLGGRTFLDSEVRVEKDRI